MKAKLILIAAAVFVMSAAWTSPEAPANVKANPVPEVSKPALNPEFSFFRTHRQAKNIVATWGMSSTQGVLGFVIQRTYEDPTDPYAFWEDICNLACNPARSFKHTDTNVYPGYIHYRIVALMDNGSSVVSETNTVRIVSR